MKVALFCFVIFAFVVAQHDHVRVSLPQINLSEDLTQETTPVHEEFFGSASGVIANNLCREYFHTVTPVRSSGHINSGTYFVVEFTAVQNAAVSFTFGLPNQGDAFDIQSTTGGTVQGSDGGTCAVGATCRFEYYCDIYPISTTLEINTRTADGTSPVETASYDVSVRQYTDLVPVIQRTFTQSPAVVRPYAAPPANLGPENWVHYYHDLQPTIAELVAQGTLYIRVTVNDAAVNGDSFICVSQDGIVANNEANPGSVNGLDVNGNLLTGDNFLTSLTPCTTFCARRTLTATDRFFYIAFDAARFCGDTDLWIGVRTPVATTYTIDIFFNPTTIPVFESVSLTSGSGFTSEGRLSGPNDCDVANGDYSCNAYYVISAATIQANAGPDARFGPIIDIEAFGALNGDFTVHLSTTLQADANAGCAASQSCTFCDGVNGACAGESSCHLVLQPCEIVPNVDYVVTVESIRRADTSFSADFGIHIGVESSPLTTVTVPDILFGQLTIDHYAHYQAVFTENDINTDSYFEVQMNPSNPVDDSIAFAWNLNQPAGVDCFTSRGICRTQNTDCGVGYDSATTANTARTFCRFLFLACPISELVDQYVTPNSNPAITPNGEKVSALVPGTYYFAVWVPGTSSNYNAPAVEYTLNFNFHHAVPLYDNVIAPSSVYYLDYTPQYVITVPSDPTIGTIEIIADNVRNGIVRFYAKCGRLAGDCPCWEFDSTCSAQPDYPDSANVAAGTELKTHRCVMRVPRCACDSNLIYVSAKGIYPGGQSDVSYQGNVVNAPPDPIFGADPEKPATFTLLALFHKIAAVEAVEDVFVSRAGTVVTGTLDNSLVAEVLFSDSNRESLYYSVKLGAAETLPTDALFFNLFGTVSTSGVDFFTDDFDFPYVSSHTVVMAVGTSFVPDLFAFNNQRVSGGCPFDSCSISINSNQGTYEVNSDMGSCSLVYQPCSNECSGRDRSFNPDTEYFVSVSAPGVYNYYEQPIAFSLQIQLVDQSPKVLTDGLRFWSGVGQSEYLHFSFDVASSPSNSRLVMELYREDQQQTPLLFYVNYFNGVGEPVWAGRSDDCYAHMFCEVCVLDGSRQNKCVYDVSPCDLAQQSGVYYMSVSTNDFVSYPSANLYPFYDDSADPFGGYSYNRNTMYHTGKAFFTLTARYETLTELLPNGLSIPGTGGLYIEESAFYSFTVPPTTGTIVGRIFSIEFVSYDTDLFVYLSTLTPSVECTDCIESTTASQNTILRFRRTPCEREAQIYYLTISTPGGDFDDDCDRADYAVSGLIEDVTQSSVSLTTQASTRIPAFFDSSALPVVPFSVSADQYHVISFNVNAVVGEFLAITITMDVPTAGAPTFDVLLAQNQFALPGSPNDDFGFGNNPASTCPAIAGQCNGVNQNAPCTIIIHPCSLPNGQSNWFITLSGEPLAPRTSTSNINVLIEKYGSENIIQNPAEGVIETTTTNLVLNDADILFYSYQTTDTLGIAGGESLRFTITNVNTFDLRIGDETGNGCATTCSGLTCEVFACSAVSPRIWYFYVNGNNGANPILTIERTAASPSSINSITSITPNVVVDRTVGQQNPNTPQAEFEYFQYNLPAVTAANSGRYSLTTTANPANLYFLDSTTFLPGFTATGTQRVMFSDLQTGTTCGGVNRIPLDSAECCYDAVTTLFAVRNQNTPYSITLETESYLGTVSSLGSSGTVTNVILGDDRVDLISVSVASGNDLIFDVSATVGTPRIYLNRGSNAGSGAAPTTAGFCFGNIDIIDDICIGNTVPCSGTIPACRLTSCTNGAATGTNTFTFAVIGTTGDSYTISANSFSSSTTLPSSGSRTLNYPISAVTVTDTSTSADAFALYAQYQYVYATNPVDLTNYIPVASDGFNPQLYPRVVFQFSNFADSLGPVTEPFDIFIAATPAGVPTSGCYADNTEIQNPHNGFLPCLENPGTGAADATTTPGVITCSVNVCSLGCGASVYFGFAKDDALPPTSSSFTFSFSATEQYNDLQTANSINNLALAVNGNTNVIRPDADNDAIVYVRVTQPGVGPGQFPVFTVTPSAATTRNLNVQRVDGGFSCDGTPQAIPNSGCNAVSQTQTCLFEGNPCTSEFNSIDSTDPVFYRVSSTGTGAWGFTFSASVTTIQRIDTAATSLSTAQSDYAATKEITDFTWHFYSFSVADNDGYSTLSVSVSNVICEAAAASLEVYSNWGSNNPLGSFADSHLPNQWPSDTCNLDSATLTGNNAWTSYAMDTCEFNAGGYRVAIFADRNTQLFPDPQTLPGPVPTVYSISASLSTLQRITLTGCSLTQQLDANFIQRIEIPIEAANRGSRLKFHLTKENVASTAALQVSRNSYTYGLTNTCHFDDDTDAGVYSCTANAAASTCEIEINRCSFFDGMWYAFISSSVADSSDLTVSYTIDTPYIPVIDSVANSGQAYTGRLLNDDDDNDNYQFYKITGSSAFITELRKTNTCDFPGSCQITQTLFTGARGHGYTIPTEPSLADCNDQCDCACGAGTSCTVANIGDVCREFISGCSSNSDYFIGLVTPNFDIDCTFSLTVTDIDPSTAVTLNPSVSTCVSNPCVNLFEVNIPAGQIGLLNVVGNSGNVVPRAANQLYFSADTNCFAENQACFSDSPLCQFDLTSCEIAGLTNTAYILIIAGDCSTCTSSDSGYSIEVILEDAQPAVVNVGTPLAAGSAFGSITVSSPALANQDLRVFGPEVTGPISFFSICPTTCASALLPGSYVVANPSAGLTLSSLSITPVTTAAVTTTLNGDGEQNFFSYVVPAGVTSFQVFFESVTYSPFDLNGGDINNLDIEYTGSFGSIPAFGCTLTCGNNNDPLGNTGCPSSFAPRTITACPGSTYYFALSICNSLSCPVTLSVRVAATASATLAPGGTHANAFTSVSATRQDCLATAPNLSLYTTVTDILLVSIRQPGSLGAAGDTVSVTVSSCAGAYGTCSIDRTDDGVDSSCSVPQGCRTAHCAASGQYQISFSAPAAPYEFEYQIITQYVDLASAISQTIIGDHTHFYRVTDAENALSISLDIASGPGLKFTVLDGCQFDVTTGFVETQFCAFGTCNTWLPTAAKQSSNAGLYITLDSSTNTAAIARNTKEINVNYEKDTAYTLTVVRGASNCGTPPTSGFCADPSRAGINVWSDVTNNVWTYSDMSSKDSEAECYYNSLLQRCAAPSTECKQFLKTYACVSTFPQCDANGYQMGVCADLCNQVEAVCGKFAAQGFELLDCSSPSYTPASTGSCANNLPVTQPPVVVDPLSFFNDDDDDLSAVLFSTLDTPSFDTIVATIPPIVNDDDDDKLFVNNEVTIPANDTSDSSAIAFSAFFLLFVVFLI